MGDIWIRRRPSSPRRNADIVLDWHQRYWGYITKHHGKRDNPPPTYTVHAFSLCVQLDYKAFWELEMEALFGAVVCVQNLPTSGAEAHA